MPTKEKKVALLCVAHPVEIQDFLSSEDFRASKESDSAVLGSAPIGNYQVDFAKTGVGMKAAERFAERVFPLPRADFVVSAGFGGALAPHLRVGDCVAGEKLFLEDGSCVFPDEALYAALWQSLPTANFGTTLTTSEAVPDADGKARLFADTGALCADMESAVLLRRAQKAGLPAVALRAVLDTAEETLDMPWPSYRKTHAESVRRTAEKLCEALRTFLESLS